MDYPAFFPQPLPDELLYSVAARYHLLAVNHSSIFTCDFLFSNRTGGLNHDFPYGLQAFATNTNCLGGDGNRILEHLTILPFFEPFLTASTALAVKAAMLSCNAKSIKFSLGLPPAQVDATHPLRMCFDCLDADIRTTGFSYWHRAHQLPGVLMCAEHMSPLIALPLKINRLWKHSYLLPSDLATDSLVSSPHHSKPVSDRLVELSLNAKVLMFQQWPPLDPFRLWHTYRHGLREHGFLSRDGQIRQQYFQDAFSVHYAPLKDLLYFRELLSTNAIRTFCPALVRKPRAGKHPLKHLLMIGFLFGDIETFKKYYDAADVHAEGRPANLVQISKPTPNNSCSPSSRQLNDLLIAEGLSLRQAAHQLGLTASTLAVHAARAGIMVKSRAKTLTPEIRAAIGLELSKGTHPATIMQMHHVSRTSVYRIQQSDTAIFSIRMSAKLAAKRSQFAAFTDANPEHTRKMLERSIESGFRWLYRNDKAWLVDHLPKIVRCQHRRPRVDWAKRDADFSAEIEEFMHRPCDADDMPTHISRSHIYRHIPDLGKKGPATHKLPLTTELLRCSMERTDDFHRRKLAWDIRQADEGRIPAKPTGCPDKLS